MTTTRDQLPFSPEDQLILSILRLDASRESAMREALQQPIDWPVLQRRAIMHRVLPLVYTRLAGRGNDLAPSNVLDRMRELYEANSRRVLMLHADLLKVIRLLKAQGIEAIPLKGLVLAELAYGDPSLRHFIDLDLLIASRHLARAQRTLLDAGVALDTHERVPSPAEALEMKVKRHQNYRLSPRSARIELHWQLGSSCYPEALPVDACFIRSETRSIAGHPLRVLSLEDQVLFLCYHGAQHYWSRFSHIADFAALAAQLTPSAWGKVIDRSTEQGISRMLITGLYLARRLLALPLPAAIARMVEADRAGDSLTRLVHVTLTRHAGVYPGLPEQGKFRFIIADNFRPLLRWVADEILSPSSTDHQWVRLPRLLWGAYWVLRPIRHSIKVLHRSIQKKPKRHHVCRPPVGRNDRVSGEQLRPE